MEELRSLRGVPHNFEFCLMVDNSGSMGPKADATKLAVVVLCEALRRAELQFSVVRFGNKSSQVVLKDAGEKLDAAKGQLILEAFTWQEGTYPATACGFVGEHVFK